MAVPLDTSSLQPFRFMSRNRMSICDLLIDLNHLNPFLDLPSRPFLQPRGSSMSSKPFYSCGNIRAKNNKGQNNSALIGKVFKCVTLCNQVQVGPIFHSMLSHVNDWPRGRVISVNLFRWRISFQYISHFFFSVCLRQLSFL